VDPDPPTDAVAHDECRLIATVTDHLGHLVRLDVGLILLSVSAVTVEDVPLAVEVAAGDGPSCHAASSLLSV
jgi:hypothetical protein